MAVYLSPVGNDAPFVDSSGNPLSGGLLYTYAAGSSTPTATYTTSAGSVAHANPVVLNANGYPAASGSVVSIWLTAGQSYKFVLKTSAGVEVWSRDNIDGINDAEATLDEWVAGNSPTFVSSTSFSVAGDQSATYSKGRRVKIVDSGGTKYCTVTDVSFSTVTTVTVAGDTLASPLTSAAYSLVSATNPTISAEMIYRKGSAVASAATCNIWNIAGDLVHVTGSTGPITSFGTAPYAGAERTVIFDSTPTITHNATTLVLPGGANIVAAANDRMIIRADTTANMVVIAYIKASGKSVINTANTQPTRQVLTSGSGATYTTPANCTRINVRMVGGGAGGGGATANNGTAGNNTTFSTLTAGGGAAGGANGTAGGAGGTASGGDINIPGGGGGGGGTSATAGVAFPSGAGGNSALGGGGAGVVNATGSNGAANSGGGGSGGGGGAAGYVEKLILSPAATYTYTVGAAANGGAAGGAAGGNGAAGIIIVDEFYD